MDRRRLRRFAGALIPAALRPAARRWAADAPGRVRDLLPDLCSGLGVAERLPPARLRSRVGLTSSRAEFLRVGRMISDDLVAAVTATGAALDAYPIWLDFGCGSGRVARRLAGRPAIRELVGVDVDPDAVAWCRRHLRGRYEVVGPLPPTSLGETAFDLIYAVSVFSHFDEASQLQWLAEARRLLRPGGLFVASTHSPELIWSRPDLTPEQRDVLAVRGFLFAPAGDRFNDDAAFHSEAYLERTWSSFFDLRRFAAHGLAGYQDLSVWERPRS